jgi:hypothetical protein
MKRKKRKITDEEIRRLLGEEFYERHERTQRLLARAISRDYRPKDPRLADAIELARREPA